MNWRKSKRPQKKIQGNKINFEKKKHGWKKKDNNYYFSLNSHNTLSKGNIIYKIKVRYHKFIYQHLNYYLPINKKLKKNRSSK